MKLAGKVAIVTGGGRGIGRAIALAFAREGAAVTLAARTLREIEEVANQIRRAGGSAHPVRTDVSQERDAANLVSQTIERFQRIDILVNNAGTHMSRRRVVDTTLDEWHRIIGTNLTGAFLCARAVLPQMMSQGSGKIVNISSIGGRQGAYGVGSYRASKAGMINLSETLAAEAKEYGIDVNCICPGAVDTPMVPPSPNLTRPDEIAKVAVFLASSEASAITGAIIDAFGDSNPLFNYPGV